MTKKMKKMLKILGWTTLIVICLMIGFSIYMYQSNDVLRAIINNDESKLFYFPEKEVKPITDLDYSENSLIVDDSITIHTYEFKSSKKETIGNIFLIHGAGGNISTYQNLIKPLVREGFSVYAAEWRGYGKSTGTPNYTGVLRDTQTSFYDFRSKTANDSIKTIIYGMSLGGQLAVKITKDNQDIIDALVLDGSVQSAQQIAMDFAPVDFLKQRAKEHPEKFNQDYIAVQDIEDIVHIPKLIIHSKKDIEVPFNHGEALFEHAREPKSFWETDTSHIMTLKEYPQETIARIHGLLQE